MCRPADHRRCLNQLQAPCRLSARSGHWQARGLSRAAKPHRLRRTVHLRQRGVTVSPGFVIWPEAIRHADCSLTATSITAFPGAVSVPSAWRNGAWKSTTATPGAIWREVTPGLSMASVVCRAQLLCAFSRSAVIASRPSSRESTVGTQYASAVKSRSNSLASWLFQAATKRSARTSGPTEPAPAACATAADAASKAHRANVFMIVALEVEGLRQATRHQDDSRRRSRPAQPQPRQVQDSRLMQFDLRRIEHGQQAYAEPVHGTIARRSAAGLIAVVGAGFGVGVGAGVATIANTAQGISPTHTGKRPAPMTFC